MSTLSLPSSWHPAAPPPPWPGGLPMVSPTLARTLLLALLLHVWLVLLLGNAPGGTAQPGQGVGGAINVTLRGPASPGKTETPPPPLPTGPAGGADLPRWGGAVREAVPVAPEPPVAPGAARLGDWAAAPAPEALTRLAAPEAPSAAVPALPSPSPAVAAELPTATTPLALPLPLPPPLPLPLPLPQAVERRLASPLAAPPERARASPALAAPAAAAAPLAWPAAPPALVQPLASVAAPQALSTRVPMPAANSLPVPALASVPGAADLPDLPSAAALPALAPVPAPAALPEQPLPRLARPLPATTVPVAPLVSPDRQPVDLAAPVPLPQALPALGPVPSMPALGAAPARAGTPDAGSQVGHDVATPPSAAASVLPRLNLQLARPRGGELSRFSAPGVLPLLPRPPELPDKLARDIAKSAKGDCRTAYQGAGLLAVVPLAAEALRKDSGCKW